MNIRIRYSVLPILYIAIVILLLANYFIESDQTSFEIGKISVSLVEANKEDRRKITKETIPPNISIPITSISISFAHITIEFDNITSISSDESNVVLSSISALPHGSGFVLAFDEQVYISFQTDISNPDEIAILLQSKESQPVDIPLSFSFGISPQLQPSKLLVSSPKSTFSITSSLNANVSQVNNKEWFLSSKSNYAFFQISKITDTHLSSVGEIDPIQDTIQITTEDTIQQYLDTAYEGWMNNRFDTTTGMWQQPEGFYLFSEDILMASYAEILKRNSYAKYKININKALFFHQNALTWRSAPINQDGNNAMLSLYNDIESIQKRVSSLIAQDNTQYLSNFEFWESLPLWDPSELQLILEDIQSIPALYLYPEYVAMILYFYDNIPLSTLQEYIQQNKRTLIQNLIAHTTKVNQGYMMINSQDTIDILYSIVAGRVLIDHSEEKEIKNLGYSILHTVLSLADYNAYLPRFLKYKDQQFSPLGFVVPEKIYFLLSHNEFFPRIQFHSSSKVFSYSAIPLVISQSSTSAQILLKAKNTQQVNFVFVGHMPKPRNIIAFDLNWNGRAFPTFLTRGVGYNSSQKLLYIKITNSASLEEITLRF